MFHYLIYEANGSIWSAVYSNLETAKSDLRRYGCKGVIFSKVNGDVSVSNYGLVEDLTDHSDEL